MQILSVLLGFQTVCESTAQLIAEINVTDSLRDALYASAVSHFQLLARISNYSIKCHVKCAFKTTAKCWQTQHVLCDVMATELR